MGCMDSQTLKKRLIMIEIKSYSNFILDYSLSTSEKES